MGSKYLAGTVKISQNEMLHSEGRKIIVAISRCMDQDSFCQLQIERVVTKVRNMYRSRDPKNIMKKSILNTKNRDEEMERSPTIKNIFHVK